MKKKGFTLVELLAVIVILAIILAIAIPAVTSLVDSSKKNAFNSDAKLVIKTANLKKMEDNNFDPTTYNSDLPGLVTTLHLDPANYTSINFVIHEEQFYVNIVGKNKWEGLSACGSYQHMNVVEGTCEIDITDPVIALNGSSTEEVYLNYSTYTETGATITDNSGETLTPVIVGTVDSNTLGSYIITYTATDSSGNTVSITKTVNVVAAPLAVVITQFLTNKNGANYYTGANPSNWVEFGQVSSGDTTPIMWRIIRKDAEGLKIIYEGTKNGVSAPTADGKISSRAWNTLEYLGWENATSIRPDLTTWYNNFYAIDKANYVNPINWCIGAAGVYAAQSSLDTFLTLECSAVTAYGPAKTSTTTAIGLINPSWYISTTSSSGCNGDYDTVCGTNNFLFKSYAYWTMNKNSPNTDNEYTWSTYTDGSLLSSYGTSSFGVRPVINLNLNVIKASGTGTLADPYTLE
ncbi:MAG: DUF5011 domain-containing protein [Bacilli bacterium]|nr:DUF5011 domain-containing protein [Bacilli bacterium]